MREVATQLFQAGAQASPGHARLIGVGRAALTEVREGSAATFALVLIASCLVVFVAASLARGVGDTRLGRASWVLTGIRLCALVIGFGALAYQVRISGTITAADQLVLNWLTEHRSAWLTGPAIAITDAGSPVGTFVLAIVIGAIASRRAHSLLPAIILVGTVGAAGVASTVTKGLVGRQRPPLITQVLLETDHSFPSGHVTGAMALFGMTAVMLGFGLPTAQRWALGVLAGLVTVLVAATRLYLGEHWFTDVVGGVVLGGAAVLAGSAVYVAWMSRIGVRDCGEYPVRSVVTDTTTMGTAA
ncbi:phosphatase PAP2 family protein [Rhodococcus sp. NPDC127530]|uniref:phosphatase PAP2 family protein n=1 Tax=unclassified Rhodococcus (in: high G+C Gram-positive bacteria) TaxID=192944 RepID=UPI00363870D3